MAKVNGEDGFTQLSKLNVLEKLLVKGIPVESTAATNVHVINSADDFPDAVGGVRELTGGDEVAYQLASDVIDIGSDRLQATGGRLHITGLHPTESEIRSTTSSPLITMDNCGGDLERFIVRNPNGDGFAYSGDINTTGLVMDRVLFASCQYISQNISGAVAASFNRCVFLSSTVGGITFGSGNSQLIFLGNACGLQSGFLGWTGVLLDLGSAQFNLINIGSNRVFPGSGDTFLSGAAGGVNVSAGGAAELTSNLFIGAGNSITTITAQDDGWLFAGNEFNDGIANTRNEADSFLLISETVPINTQGVYEFIGGSNWQSDFAEHFTVSSAGVVTHTGLKDLDVVISATATVEKVGGGSDKICMKIAIDGAVSDKTISCTQNNAPTGITSQGLFRLEGGANEELRPYVANTGSTADVVVSACNVVIKG
jgi:hypothetical protein